jgi:toxin ParE1/3/4
MAKYILSHGAKEDLIRIHQFGVKKFGMRQADEYYDNFFTCFERIASNPHAFESIEHIRKGYRRCVCGADSIYFRLKDGMIEIMAVAGKQDLEKIL